MRVGLIPVRVAVSRGCTGPLSLLLPTCVTLCACPGMVAWLSIVLQWCHSLQVGCDWKGMRVNTKGAKLLIFSLIITLFSLMLVFAGFVYLLLGVANRVISTSYPGGVGGRGAYVLLVLAVTAGVGGLFVAWFGLNRND